MRTATAWRRAARYEYVALCTGLLAASLQLSAMMFTQGTPPGQIGLALAASTAATWYLLDGTRQGLACAALCALGAPAAEVVLMGATHCWHYTRPDVGGVFVSWVPWCYAFYTPTVANLARHLWLTSRRGGGGGAAV